MATVHRWHLFDTSLPGDTSDTADTADTADTGDTVCAPSLWYTDADGDGFGDLNLATEACEVPEGMVVDGTDCDDADAQVYPGAPELCRDGVVNDCDAEDEAAAQAFCSGAGPFSLDEADATIIGVSRVDRCGARVRGAQDLNGDGLDDVLVGASSDGAPRVTEVLSPVTGTLSLADAGASIHGESASDVFGVSLSGAGDVDGDGLTDVIIGALGADRVYLVLSPVTGDMSAGDADTVFTAALESPGGSPNLGYSVAGLGDVDGDGLSDLLLGAPFATGLAVDSDLGDCASESSSEDELGPGVWAGVSYLFTASPAGTVDVNDADARLLGEDGEDEAGVRMAAPGDMNGDGLADMALVAGGNCEGGENQGAIYVVEGPVSGDLYLGDADGKIVGSWSRPYFDGALSEAGDVNGDGTPDLLSWSELDSYSSENGLVYLYLGPVLGSVSATSNVAFLDGTDETRADSIAAAGDLDLDGYDDVLVGGKRHTDYAVLAAIFYGPLSGTISLESADQTFVGPEGSATAVAGAGDTDADGRPDVLVGAEDTTTSAGRWSGAAWLLLGGGALLSGNGEI